MCYYYRSTRGRGHTWLLTADEQRRDFKKPFTTNCQLELSDAGHSLPNVLAGTQFEGEGVTAHKGELTDSVCTQLGLFHISPIVSLGKEMDSSICICICGIKCRSASETLK